MKIDGTLFAAAALAVLVSLLAAAPAAACMCVEPPPPAQALEEAYAVFAGRVVTVEKTDRRTDYGRLPRLLVTVKLSAVWKGVPDASEVQVWTGLGDGDCGYGFEEGTQVLVYAEALADGDLDTSLCSRTKRLEAAAAAGELEALGEPVRKPTPLTTPPAPPGSR